MTNPLLILAVGLLGLSVAALLVARSARVLLALLALHYRWGAGRAGDLCFYWPALAGLLLLLLARDVLRWGVALLVLLHSGGLLAGLLAGRFEPLAGGLPALGTIIIALALAYIWA